MGGSQKSAPRLCAIPPKKQSCLYAVVCIYIYSINMLHTNLFSHSQAHKPPLLEFFHSNLVSSPDLSLLLLRPPLLPHWINNFDCFFDPDVTLLGLIYFTVLLILMLKKKTCYIKLFN